LFRIAVNLCLALIIFTLVINFVDGLDLFMPAGEGIVVKNTSSIIEKISGYEGKMAEMWLFVVSLSGVTALMVGGVASVVTRSPAPIGIAVFGTIFWVSYVRALTVLSANQYIPNDFLLIGTCVVVFIFIGAVIGMLTGSG